MILAPLGAPKSLQKLSPLGSWWKLLFRSILDHFGSDFGPPWEGFWTPKWCQIHKKVKKFKVSLGHVQPKLRTSLDQVWNKFSTKFKLSLEQIQSKFKPGLDQVWTKSEPSFDQI